MFPISQFRCSSDSSWTKIVFSFSQSSEHYPSSAFSKIIFCHRRSFSCSLALCYCSIKCLYFQYTSYRFILILHHSPLDWLLFLIFCIWLSFIQSRRFDSFFTLRLDFVHWLLSIDFQLSYVPFEVFSSLASVTPVFAFSLGHFLRLRQTENYFLFAYWLYTSFDGHIRSNLYSLN